MSQALQTKEIKVKVKDLLDSSNKWTKNHYARDIYGHSVSQFSNYATCFCLDGAMQKCYGTKKEYIDISKKVLNYLHTTNKIHEPLTHQKIFQWNDKAQTTFKDIKELVQILDI